MSNPRFTLTPNEVAEVLDALHAHAEAHLRQAHDADTALLFEHHARIIQQTVSAMRKIGRHSLMMRACARLHTEHLNRERVYWADRNWQSQRRAYRETMRASLATTIVEEEGQGGALSGAQPDDAASGAPSA